MIFPYDYYHLWAAGRVARAGANVYDPEILREVMLKAGWPNNLAVWGFLHPPWSIEIFIPFAFLPFTYARILWTILLIVLFIYTTLVTERICSHFTGHYKNLSRPALFFSLLAFPPIIKIFAYGQTSFFILLGLLLFIDNYLNNRRFRAGVFLSFTLIKPQALLVFYLAFFLRQTREKNFLVLGGMLFGFLLQVLISIIIYPQGYLNYFQHLPQVIQASANLPGAALSQVLLYWTKVEAVRPLIMCFGVFIGIFFGLKRNVGFRQLIVWMLPISCLATPYAFLHTYCILSLPFVFIVGDLYCRFGEKTRYYLILLALCGISLVTFINFEPLSVFLPLAILLGVVIMERKLLS